MGYAFENYYEDTYENYNVIIFIGRDSIYENEQFIPSKFVDVQLSVDTVIRGVLIGEYNVGDKSGLCVGEALRDKIGYGPAKDMLTRMGIPKECLIWKLGEKG
jgi:hypothetical protein